MKSKPRGSNNRIQQHCQNTIQRTPSKVMTETKANLSNAESESENTYFSRAKHRKKNGGKRTSL